MSPRRLRTVGPVLAMAVVAISLTGCGPPTLDPSDYRKLETSVNKLREPMEQDQRARFNEALTYLVGDAAVIPENLETAERPEHPEILLALYEPLQGMTAEEIIADARRHRLAWCVAKHQDMGAS